MAVAFGKYHLIATLGQGGMADVYLAVVRGPVGFRKLVVVKRLRPDVVERTSFTSMLLEEAQLAARLQHPNVVQTFDVGVHEGEHYMAMEYLDGQPLARILRIGGRPPPSFAARVMGDALAGLHYAHDLADYDGKPLGIVHRDVSPQNLFVTYAGEVKVVDFGIAKVNTKVGDQTEAGTIKGKPAYMAPEQVSGKPLDRRTDVFAAGIVFWELLTGRRLFKADSQGEAVAKVLLHEIERPSVYAPDVPKELEDICLRSLERDPERRYQTAGEMREAIYAYMERGGGMRRDDAGKYVESLFRKQREEVKAQITEFMATAEDGPPTSKLESLRTLKVTAGSGSGSGMSTADAPTRAQPPAPPTKNKNRLVLAGIALLVIAALVTVVFIAPRANPKPLAATDAAPQPHFVEPAPVLVLGGSGTIGVSAAPAFVEAFFKKRGALSVERRRGTRADDTIVVATTKDGAVERVLVASDGTSRGFQCLGDKSCDIAMAAREISSAEAADLAQRGLGDMRLPASEHVIALDGIAVVVHPNNPLRMLDRAKLGHVFSGDATDWSTVGGAPGTISVVAHEEGSGTTDVLRALVLGGREITPSAKRLPDNARIADEVARTPNAIGFVGLAFVGSTKALAISEKGAPPMVPSPFTVTTEAYALSRRFYLYTQPQPKPLALELIDFVASSDGQKVMRASGFVDLDVSLKNAEPCDHCPAQYAALTKRARRLSLDFRFRAGTQELDTRSTRDVARVVAFLREHASARILLFGFSEATRDAKADQKRSRDLARAVDRELAARGLRASVVDGFGGEMPVAAGEGDAARVKNRRVEIWLQSDRP